MAWRLFLAAFAVYAALALATGEYLNERDSEARLVAARGAARGDALVLLHPWHKPVLTALAAGVLRLSGDVVALKVLQGALAAGALALAAAAARNAGARAGAAVGAAAAAGLAPFWVRGVVSLLTETSCAFLLALALWLWSRGRPALSALAVSVSFLARFDGFLFALAWTPFLLLPRLAASASGAGRRSWLGLAALAAAPLAWHLAGWAATGDPGFLVTRQPHPVTGSSYASGSFFTIAALLPATAGLVLVPAIAGLSRARGPALAAAGVALLAHSSMWGLGLMGSYGLPRYLVTIVPTLAVAGAFGLERFGRAPRAALFALAAAAAVATATYRDNAWAGEVRLARTPLALTEDPVVSRLNGGGARVERWPLARPGDAIAWDSVWTPDGDFDAIPKDRLVLESTVREPARWFWEVDWEGRIYRIR